MKNMKWKFRFKAKHDIYCREFHITPVLTFARPDRETEQTIGKGYALALEWGKYYVMVLACKLTQK